MPDITSAASEFTDVRPRTSYLDPAQGLSIMQRYGASQVGRGFAEDALKSANEIDKAANYDPQNRRNDLESHEWRRDIKDRDDEEYAQKKEFESTRAEWLVKVAALDPSAPDFDTRSAELFADPAAAEDDAGKIIFNLKVQARDEAQRLQAQEFAADHTLAKRYALKYNIPVEELVVDGAFNIARGYELDQLAARGLEDEKLSKELYGDDVAVRGANTVDAASGLEVSRRKDLVGAAAAQGLAIDEATLNELLPRAADMAPEAFLAQLVSLAGGPAMPEGFESWDPDAQKLHVLKLSSSSDSKIPDEFKKTVYGLHKAALRKSQLVTAGAPKSNQSTPSEPEENPAADPYFQ